MENVIVELNSKNNIFTSKEQEQFEKLKEDHNDLICKYQMLLNETNIPVIYDICADSYRLVTKEDIRQFGLICNYYARMLDLFSEFDCDKVTKHKVLNFNKTRYLRVPIKNVKNLSKKLLALHEEYLNRLENKSN